MVGTLQALRYLSAETLQHLVESGRWSRPHRGVLVAHNGPLTVDHWLWVAALGAGGGRPALLAGRTALATLGLRGFPSGRIHVLLGARRHPIHPPPGVVVHRTTSVTVDDISLSGQPSTTAARSVIDAASWARSDDEARTVVAMAFQQRLTTYDAIGSTLERMPRAKRRRLVLRTAADADGGAHSLGELHAAELIRRAGLPAPSAQHVRVDACGRRRYLDLYWERYRLHVEIDGAGHDNPAESWRDAQRQNDLWIEGGRVLRFPVWLVREQPAVFVDQVRRALSAAGWTPPDA